MLLMKSANFEYINLFNNEHLQINSGRNKTERAHAQWPTNLRVMFLTSEHPFKSHENECLSSLSDHTDPPSQNWPMKSLHLMQTQNTNKKRSKMNSANTIFSDSLTATTKWPSFLLTKIKFATPTHSCFDS